MWTDSSSAKSLIARRGPGRMKHIDIKMLAIQEWAAERLLSVSKVTSEENASYLLTKAMTRDRMVYLGRKLGLSGGIF